MRILVCGGRDYADSALLFSALDSLRAQHGVELVIHGAARGADTLAENWAKNRQVPYLGVPACWDMEGKAAGMNRNHRMLDYAPQYVVAFPGGAGTAGMVRIAKEAGLPVWDLGVKP